MDYLKGFLAMKEKWCEPFKTVRCFIDSETIKEATISPLKFPKITKESSLIDIYRAIEEQQRIKIEKLPRNNYEMISNPILFQANDLLSNYAFDKIVYEFRESF